LFRDRIYPERSKGSRRTGLEFCTEILRLEPQDRFCRETRQNLIINAGTNAGIYKMVDNSALALSNGK
jgi:hypothetical protein